MHVMLRLLGCTVLEFHTSDDEPTAVEYDDEGSVTTYPVGFTAGHPLPDEAGLGEQWADE